MSHEVFISHSDNDKAKADAVCRTLESRKIRCWIAPRDILPGTDWGAAIIEAISKSRVMILVFSSSANNSAQVKREVERAVSKNVIIVPLRLENVPLSGSLEYFLSVPHWIDASTYPFEKHLEGLAESINALLGKSSGETQAEPPGDQTGEIRQIAKPQASQRAVATSLGRQVHSIREVEELSENSRVLLVTFEAEPGQGETNVRTRLQDNVLPKVRQLLESKDVTFCYARAKYLFFKTDMGKELSQLRLEPLGMFLFINGKLVNHRKLSYVSPDDEYINTLKQLLDAQFAE